MKLQTGQTVTVWAKSKFPNWEFKPLYGAHPFYIEMREGVAHGVFMLNSNAMDIVINVDKNNNDIITWRMVGGIVDLFVFR